MLDKIKSAIPLNWSLMASPANWIILLLMLMIVSLGVSMIRSASTSYEGTTDNG